MNKHASMNRSFRLVWSRARGQYIVASELARGRSKSSCKARTPVLSAIVAGLGLAGISGLAGAQVVPATTVVPTGGNTHAYISPNGVPVVNINTANSAGVSHNQYTRYDVEANGLVLNNGNIAQSARQSQLAGQVVANINLGAEARVILNEVVAARRSSLAGFTEVVGGKADVIVANPYGITCAGCGFINSDRVTLTTGTPNFGYDGSVAGFSVHRGDILVNGGGLNATAQQILDLVTRSVKIDGQINTAPGGSLGIVTGLNTWSYGTREVTGSTTAADATPSFAIDSTALGGIYAGRIRLIATEAGVGVRMLGDAAASVDDFTLSSAGKVEVRSKLSAERDLALASTDAAENAIALNDANVSARRDLSLIALQGGAAFNGGVLVASNDLSMGLGMFSDTASGAATTDNNKRFAGNAYTLNVTGAAAINGVNHGAGGAFTAQTGSLAVGGDGATLYGGTTLGLTTTTGNMALAGASVSAKDDLSLTSNVGNISIGSGASQGVQSTEGDIVITAATGLTNSGTVSAEAGDLRSRVNGSIDNSGTLHAGTEMDITDRNGSGTQNVTNSGTLIAGGTLAVQANNVGNTGDIQGTNGTTFSAAMLNNTGSLIASDTAGAAASFTLSDSFDNSGTLQGKGAVTVTATNGWTNSGKVLALSTANGGSAGALQVSGTTLTNSGTLDAGGSLSATATGTNGTSFDNTGAIQAAGTMTLGAGAGMSNSGTVIGDAAVTISSTLAAFDLANLGRIQSGGAMTLGGAGRLARLTNQSTGIVFSGSTLNLTGGNLNNQGRITATDGTTMNVASLTNGTSSNHAAVIVGATGNGASTINATGALDNYGAVHSNGNLSINAAGVTNRNTGGLSSLTSLTVEASGSNNIDNYGALYAGNALDLTATDGSITNRSGTGTMDSSGTITTKSAHFTNNNAVVASGDITIDATSSFMNETMLNDTAISKTRGPVLNVVERNSNKIAAEAALDYGSNVWVIDEDFTQEEALVGMSEDALAALPKAQIISNGSTGTLTIKYGGSGLNKIAVLSAPTINISGSGTFTNEDMSLLRYDLTRRWIRVDDESSGDDDFVTWASIDPFRKTWDGNPDDCDGACNWDDWNPGAGWKYIGHVEGGGFPDHLKTDAQNEAVAGAIPADKGDEPNVVVVKRFGAGIFATNLNINSGALNNISSPHPADKEQAKVGSAQSGSVSTKSATGAAADSKSGVAADTGLSFGGLNVSLPQNPNGFFITPKDPNAQYLVETNPLFDVGSNFVGSDYLAVRLGINPDTVQKRLGDSNYEAYLIRQQLINQTGSNILKGYGDEAAQMRRLMDQGAAQGAELGLTFGQAPTAAQLAGLKDDMVWMVETVVGGQKVLAPVVYLAASTRDMVEGGAVIAGTNVNLDVASLNNTGGTIAGDSKLNIKSKGDITNLSGNIKGGDVSLTSTEGSIKNETFAQGAGDNSSYATTIGKTAGITATGNLNMDAAKDITVKGADVKAEGDVSLAAGENVTFDTIVNKSAETTYSTSNGFLSSSTETKNTITTTNIGSNLGAGGNLTIKSGKDTTIAGSNVDVGGDLKVDAAGDFNVVSRQDTKETNTTSTGSGLGVGGGLYGTTETVTNNFQGRNVASSLKVGGNADINTANTMTVQGSNIDIGGNASIKADDVQVLAGQDVDRTTTRTTTTTFLKLEGPEGETSAGAGAGARAGADSMARGGNASAGAAASAEAGAGASASGSAGVTLAETSTTNTFDLSQRSVGSALNIGGNLAIDSNKSITLQGANVEVGGDADLKAKDIKVLAAQDVNISTSKTTTTSIGLYVDSTNSAQAGASAGAGASAYANSSADANGLGGSAGAGAGAYAGAQANASASSDTNIDIMRTKTTESESLNITNTGSVLKVGGKLNATAENKLTVQGSDISGEQGVSVKAKDMEFLAAEDVSYSSTKTTTVSAGLYITGNAEADAGANASVQADAAAQGGLRGGLNQDSAQASLSGSASAEAGAGASAKIGAGIQTRTNSTTTTEGSTTARVSSIRSGSGSIERVAENRILDQGTEIEAAGDFTQSATTIDSVAARNTSFSTTESESHTARVGVYLQGNAEARASASAEGNAGAGYLGGNTVGMESSSSAEAGANASAGIEAQYTMDKSGSSSSSSQAVVSTIKAGGKVSSTSSGKTTFEGTKIEGGSEVDIAAKEIDFKAARDTETSSENAMTIGAAANLGLNLGSDGAVEGGVSGSFNKDDASSSSSTAVVGSIQSGGKLNIRTEGDARFEGTEIGAAGDASIAAGGDLKMEAARNEASESGRNINAEASVSISRSGGGAQGGESSKGMGFAAAGGYSNDTSSSTEAVTGSINAGGNLTLSAGKNASFEGTAISAGGDTDLAAGGNVTFEAARNTSSSESTSVSASVELGKSNSSNASTGEASSSSSASFGAEAGYSREKSSEAVTGSLETGGNLRIRSGGDTTFVGTDLAAGGSAAVDAGGNVNFKAAESTSESFNVGGSVGMAGSTTNTTPGKAEAPPAGAGAAAATAGVAKPSAGTDASAAEEPAGPSTERERSGSFGIEAGYSTSTERKGGSISAGSGGLQISAGKNANFEGTKVSSEGDASISAGGDVNFTTARSTSSSIGGSIGGEAESKSNTGDPTQDSSTKGGSIGIEAGLSSTHEGASIESGGKLNIASGGKTTLVNTEMKAEEGTSIAAAGGVSRSTVSDSELTVKMSAAGTSEKTNEAPAAAADPAAAANPAEAGQAAPAADAKPEAAEAEPAKPDTAKPAAAKTEAAKKEAAKKEAAKKEAAKKEAAKKEAAKKEAEKKAASASTSAPAKVMK